MGSGSSRWAAGAAGTLLLPALLTIGAAALTFVFQRKEAIAQEAQTPMTCARWHRGAGETSPIDLSAVRRAYANLTSKLDASLAKSRTDLPDILEKPHRTSLPRCASQGARTVKLKEGVGPRLAGLHLYFGLLGTPDRFILPRAIAEDAQASIFLLGCERLADAGELSRRLKRPVHLAREEFARALGVRCAGTRVKVSANGEEVELHEGK